MVSPRSLRGLDWLNFFVASVQTGFGTFVAVFLTENRWTQGEIGFALTISTIVGLVSQVPAGGMVDGTRDKRRPLRVGIIGLSGAAALFVISTAREPVYLAEALQGLASALIGPSIAAVSLTLVGHAALSERIGRNARYASLGNGITAAGMGVIGSYVAPGSVFWLAVALCVPTIVALGMIGAERAPPDPADGANVVQEAPKITVAGLKELFLDRRLLVFGACIVLYFVANAAMLPLAATEVTKQHPGLADLIIAATILMPQGIVAWISPWIGRTADRVGRRPLMLAGWGVLPLQGLLYAVLPGPVALVVCQTLGGVSGAVFGVLMTLVAADLTRENGRFNLTLGALGVAVAAGASISTTVAGVAADAFGDRAAFLGLGLAGLCGTLLLWLAMPETRMFPGKRKG